MKYFLKGLSDVFIFGLYFPFIVLWKALEIGLYLAAFFTPILSLLFFVEWILKWKR